LARNNVAILWAWLAKCGKEISSSQNLVVDRHFLGARQAFYGSKYKNLVDRKKSARYA